jgi:dephospho-CoA kinase
MKRIVNTSPELTLEQLRKRNKQNDHYKSLIEGTSNRHKHSTVKMILDNSERFMQAQKESVF